MLASCLIRMLRRTWRVTMQMESPLPEDRRLVFCFWHGDQSALFAYRHYRKITVLTSLSQDGALQAKILASLGYVICRGSSSRGGARGLREIVRHIQGGCDAAFAVDGPTGPYHLAKSGAIQAARQSNALVVPVAVHAEKAWIFEKAWDRYVLPKPFSRVTIRVGSPLPPVELDAGSLTAHINRMSN